MPSSKAKAAAFQRPSKFNFLAGRPKSSPTTSQVFVQATGHTDFLRPENGNRRYWPIGQTPDEARRTTVATKADLKKLVRGAK